MARGRYHVATFGCRVNQADTQGIELDLEGQGLERTLTHHDADVVVLNTCTVTHRSDADVRKLVHRIQRDNPGARIVIAGCAAQRDPASFAALAGTSAVVGNAHKDELPAIVARLLATRLGAPVVVHTAMDALDPAEQPPVRPVASVVDRTRPFVKIQDGCDAACTYCVIPDVRGRARSAPVTRVLETVESLICQGYVEIVLTGVHLGTYGVGLEPPESLAGLVRRVLEVPGLRRLRLSCIEPMAFPLELVHLAGTDRRLAPHFHLPLQSGADRILKRMARPYRAREYAAILAEIRGALPDACIGTDVIVGFPGETESDFAETCRFVAGVGLDYVHVFSYSDRPGVPSTRLSDKVDPRLVKVRSTALHEVAGALWTAFLDRQVGRALPAVTLGRDVRMPSRIEALADNYAPIWCDDARLEPNLDVQVEVLRREEDRLVGRVLAPRRGASLPMET